MNLEKKNPQKDSLALAGEEEISQGAAHTFSSRLDRYHTAHKRALYMSDHLRSNGYLNLAEKLHDCGHWLQFRDYYTIGEIRLSYASFCKKHLLCPFCAIRRGAKALKMYLQRVAVVQAEQPTLKAYLVTLTVKDGPDLAERFNHLRYSMKAMSQARLDHLSNPIKNRHVEFAKAVGGVHSIEVKRGKNSGLWHPHSHSVWLCHEKPDAAKLAKEWEHWTGDSFIVDVTEFHNQEDITSGFLEVFKYALKFSDLALDDNLLAYQKLKTRRLVDSFGCLRGVQIPDDLRDDLPEDLPFIVLFYEYSRSGYQFRKMIGGGGGQDAKRPVYDGAGRHRESTSSAGPQAEGFTNDDGRGAGGIVQGTQADEAEPPDPDSRRRRASVEVWRSFGYPPPV